jgi:hypothetical protein
VPQCNAVTTVTTTHWHWLRQTSVMIRAAVQRSDRSYC